jgi:hypothetical protein
MQVERFVNLNAKPYERNSELSGSTNGYITKTVKTKLGEIRFDISPVRGLAHLITMGTNPKEKYKSQGCLFY